MKCVTIGVSIQGFQNKKVVLRDHKRCTAHRGEGHAASESTSKSIALMQRSLFMDPQWVQIILHSNILFKLVWVQDMDFLHVWQSLPQYFCTYGIVTSVAKSVISKWVNADTWYDTDWVNVDTWYDRYWLFLLCYHFKFKCSLMVSLLFSG